MCFANLWKKEVAAVLRGTKGLSVDGLITVLRGNGLWKLYRRKKSYAGLNNSHDIAN